MLISSSPELPGHQPLRVVTPGAQWAVIAWCAVDLIVGAALIALGIAAGWRLFGQGRDYDNYLAFYHQLTPTFQTSGQRFEPGFTFAAWVFKFVLRQPYEALAATVASASLLLKYGLLRRYSRHPLLALTTYLLLFYPIHEYTQIRAALGIGLAYLSAMLAIQGQLRRASMIGVFALSFHWSAGLVLVAAATFLAWRRSKVVLVLAAAGVAAASWYALTQYGLQLLGALNPLLIEYAFDPDQGTQVNLLSVLNITLVVALALRIFDRRSEGSAPDTLLLFMTTLGLGASVLLAGAPVLSQRIKELYAVGAVFWAFSFRWRGWSPTAGLLLMLAASWVLGGYIRQRIISL